MDRLRLKQYLEAAGVPEDRYLLVGVDPPRAVREGCLHRAAQPAQLGGPGLGTGPVGGVAQFRQRGPGLRLRARRVDAGS